MGNFDENLNLGNRVRPPWVFSDIYDPLYSKENGSPLNIASDLKFLRAAFILFQIIGH